MKNYQTITAEELRDLDLRNDFIIDVRTKMEHNEKRLACKHIHLPLDNLDLQKLQKEHGLNYDSKVYLLCRGGNRARQAADKFFAAGYKNIKVIDGGLLACESCGERLEGHESSSCNVKANCSISLERQVRVAAGIFTFFGTLFGIIFHQFFLAIPLFVGAGLIFAGLTNRCGMALLLTKAPWNKI
jgi:rhodanese-related sulfurtransferase